MSNEETLPIRTCGKCGAAAAGTGITRSTVNFIPVSSTHHYQCTGCGAAFSVEPTSTQVRNLFAAVVCLGLAALILLNPKRAGDGTMGWMFGAGGVVALGYAAFRRRVSQQNPVRT